jgi:SPP1 family predicted phage head-tail adaptor
VTTLLNSGDLRHRLTLQSPPAGRDGAGARTGAWTTEGTVWGAAWPVSAREQLSAGQINSEVTVRFRIRYRDDVRASWRVLWRGVPHAIVGEPIDVGGERVALDLLALAGARDSDG